jgi:peroxiredoxin (alkyl hydroperoxide reductase subunit C)
MLGIGDRFPDFSLKSVLAEKLPSIKKIEEAFTGISNTDFTNKWTVFFFYPKDFTFVCPTELVAFNELHADFDDCDAQIFGCSTDSEFVHMAWCRENEEINNLKFPLISDIKGSLSLELGILDKVEGVAQRATFIIDPDGIIRHVSVNDLNVGRNPREILRVLNALQTDELCPCNWTKGEETIDLDNINVMLS